MKDLIKYDVRDVSACGYVSVCESVHMETSCTVGFLYEVEYGFGGGYSPDSKDNGIYLKS